MSHLQHHLRDQLSPDGAKGEKFFWHRLRAEYILRMLVRSGAEPNLTLLDVGAGAGIFGHYFLRCFPAGRYAFVEPVDELARHLRARYGDAADWTSKSHREADAVILLDVIEHLEDDVGFLRNITRDLRRGVKLFVTCPAMPVLWSEWDTRLGHHRRYTAASLYDVLTTAGIHIGDVHYLFQTMFFVGLLRKYRPSRSAEFPRLGPTLNRFLYLAGRFEQSTLRWFPLGASVAATGVVP